MGTMKRSKEHKFYSLKLGVASQVKVQFIESKSSGRAKAIFFPGRQQLCENSIPCGRKMQEKITFA